MDVREQEDRSDSPEAEPDDMDRRQFLSVAAGTAGAATVTYFWLEGMGEPVQRHDVVPTPAGGPWRTFTPGEARTLGAACDRLLPTTTDSPGARTVNAIGYLDAVLQQPHILADTTPIIRDGARKLDQRARKAGAQEFAALSPGQQDQAIRVFETFRLPTGEYPGHKWLKKMLSFTLEAFLGDPVQGGNPNEVAWKWAGHKPGFPRPTESGWRMVERT